MEPWAVLMGYGPFLPTLLTVPLKGEHSRREMFTEQEDGVIMETFFQVLCH